MNTCICGNWAVAVPMWNLPTIWSQNHTRGFALCLTALTGARGTTVRYTCYVQVSGQLLVMLPGLLLKQCLPWNAAARKGVVRITSRILCILDRYEGAW